MFADLDVLDQQFHEELSRQKNNGAVDLKCHVEVTSFTEFRDQKLAMLNVFSREREGSMASFALSDLSNFDELLASIQKQD